LAPATSKIEFKFSFNLGGAKPADQANEEEKQSTENSSPSAFQKCMKLNDEKKFFVNKDLFSNPFVSLSKPVDTSSPNN
jgi:hypothetical protein